MGLYAKRIFPFMIEHVMRGDAFTAQRKRTLAYAAGRVLEIGFGTGLNLPHYPVGVDAITVLEPNPGMNPRAQARIDASDLRVELLQQRADADLPLDEGSVDTVVSTWTLCSIPDVDRAVAELFRVLRPGGRLLFIEHGLSPDARIARWQRRLAPINKCLADGCHLDRDMDAIVRRQPFDIESLDTFYLRGAPRVGGFTFRGVARKPA